MEVESCVPPGFRFHPTEEELVGYYLARKVASQKIEIEVIADVDLYRIEPWDLQDRCKHGHEDQNEWYFFSHKDKKYPTGSRTNRATAAGFWKATGRDKAVLSKSKIIGMRKTLVFYEGRAPNGRKSDWIMHEYRLQTSEHGPPQEEGWVVCRAFKKPTPSQQRQTFNPWNPSFYVKDPEQLRLLQPPLDLPRMTYLPSSYPGTSYQEQPFDCEQELQSKKQQQQQQQQQGHVSHLLKLQQLESPNISASFPECFEPPRLLPADKDDHLIKASYAGGQFVDWKALDRLLGSQLNESTSSSNSNLPLINLDYEADAQNNGDLHFLNAYPNL